MISETVFVAETVANFFSCADPKLCKIFCSEARAAWPPAPPRAAKTIMRSSSSARPRAAKGAPLLYNCLPPLTGRNGPQDTLPSSPLPRLLPQGPPEEVREGAGPLRRKGVRGAAHQNWHPRHAPAAAGPRKRAPQEERAEKRAGDERRGAHRTLRALFCHPSAQV